MSTRRYAAGTKRDAIIIGKRIKEARLRRNLKRLDAAARAGISDKTAYDIERGAPGVSFGNVLSYMVATGQRRLIQMMQDPFNDPLVETQIVEEGRQRAS